MSSKRVVAIEKDDGIAGDLRNVTRGGLSADWLFHRQPHLPTTYVLLLKTILTFLVFALT
jgi:hypothetical protein